MRISINPNHSEEIMVSEPTAANSVSTDYNIISRELRILRVFVLAELIVIVFLLFWQVYPHRLVATDIRLVNDDGAHIAFLYTNSRGGPSLVLRAPNSTNRIDASVVDDWADIRVDNLLGVNTTSLYSGEGISGITIRAGRESTPSIVSLGSFAGRGADSVAFGMSITSQHQPLLVARDTPSVELHSSSESGGRLILRDASGRLMH